MCMLNIIAIRQEISLAETEVAVATVISSHVKDKNRIFTGNEIFVTGKILVFLRCLYNKGK